MCDRIGQESGSVDRQPVSKPIGIGRPSAAAIPLHAPRPFAGRDVNSMRARSWGKALLELYQMSANQCNQGSRR